MANRRLLVALAPALTLLAYSPAHAQSEAETRSMTVTGSTPEVCSIDLGEIQGGGLVNIAGLDGDTLRIEQLADPQTLAVRAASATISFEAVCNFPHQLRLESQNNGLWPTDSRVAGAPAGFAFAVPYSASVDWGAANGQLATDGKVRSTVNSRIALNAPAAGDLTVRIDIAQGASNVEVAAPVLAGVYADTLRIFLEPR